MARSANIQTDVSELSLVLQGARNNLRVIVALIYREAGLRFGSSKLSYLMTLAEPALLVIILLGGRILLGSGNPAFGQSTMLFLLTGVVAFRATRNIIQRGGTAIQQNRALLAYGLVKPADAVFARTTVEFTIWVLILAGFFIGVSRVTDTEVITDLRGFVLALLMIYFFCLSLAMFNATIGALFPFWKTLWRVSAIPLMMTSGVVFVPSQMAPGLLNIIIWNPFLHCVEALRSSSYLDYISVYSPYYLLTLSTTLMIVSLSAESIFRKEIIRSRREDEEDFDI